MNRLARIEDLIEALAKEGEASVTGVGEFRVVKNPQRRARNPRTGETVVADESVSVKFRAYTSFRQELAGRILS